MKKTIVSIAVASVISFSAVAGNQSNSDNNAWSESAKDAWIDGKAEATLLFNGNLDSFDINTDVRNGEVILTGKVESDVDRKLAEELVLGIKGVTSVDNELSVIKSDKEMNKDETSQFTDAKIATVVKTRLLFDSDIAGTDIDVDVDNGVVMLEGEVDSAAERDLAIQIARNASDVKDVEANLTITEDS
jgi:osmotically-inducible protein OsmY